MIRFIDPIKSEFRHFNIYRNALLQIPSTELIEADLRLLPQITNKLLLLLSRIRDWRKQINKTKRGELHRLPQQPDKRTFRKNACRDILEPQIALINTEPFPIRINGNLYG